ncbi:MAG: DUF5689 domain-containing protein [Prolixibacteraceae bacterium]|jgi:hypothetical protein|nr:choice-of-anchor J domain-containing protein [Prolixibacteraceae bacterium]MDI9562783.1 DUF5689 domain-containing protein [Bacteroidota bacterium]NLS99728.1 hypothetical protein [Bacteroidales bacterium]OQB81785.1 MAG: hypothetical protein BWX87_00471 [Bacteroidetes bacterium ADurb.Bin123]HNZ67792.1 DUF5689 domain-containing protein [Prolixibacteraceae bacterium]
MKRTFYFLTLFLTGFLFLLACVDNNEEPPPDIPFRAGQVVTVDQVKALYSQELAKPWKERHPVQIMEDWALRGVITASDKRDGNLYKEAFIQDATTGLRMVFDATSGLYIGDSVVVNVKGLFLGDYGNFIQMGSEPYTDDSGNLRVSGFNMDTHVQKLSVGNSTIPLTATISQVKSAAWLGKLVKFNDVQFDDSEIGRTWAEGLADPPEAANRKLVDCSGKNIIVRTSGYASFANEILPPGKGSITGVVTVFNSDYQLLVRDYSEVAMTGNRCGYVPQPQGTPVESLSQDFETFKDNATIYISGWQNLATAGGRLWLAKLFSGNTYAQATGYNSGLSSMVTWLVTNPITLSSQKVLTFETAKAYWAHTGDHFPLDVLFSTNFNGNNLTSATWVPLTGGTLAQKADPDHTFINSGNVMLPVEAGKSGVVAFRYTGSGSESTTYRIDNIVIKPAN